MSTIPTKQIDGDVSIGRNITAGGDVTLRGSAKICHNLKVEGWLEAPNIKGPNKGLFYHEEALKNYYPNPRAGWWALVGDCLPARLFFVVDGKWEETGNYCGEPDIDASEYNRVVHELDGKIDRALESGEQNALNIEAIRLEVAQIIANAATKNEVAELRSDLESVSEAAQEALTAANEAGTSVALLKARHEKEVAQINTAHKTDVAQLTKRIDDGVGEIAENLENLTDFVSVDLEQRVSSMGSALSQTKKDVERYGAVFSADLARLGDNIEAVSEDLSESVGEAQTLAQNALDNAAIYPFGGVYPLVDAMPSDGRIGFITSLKRFAKNPDNASLGEYNTEDGKARTDCLFRDGNRLYRVGSDGLLEEYANSLLGATVENLGHEVVGIWDEINAVKELMTYRGRIEAALRKLDYDDADIETFIYLNTHFPDSDFTVPAIESDAENWIRWKSKYWEYNSGEMMDEAENNTMTYQLHRILPKYPKEWEEDVRKPSPEAFGKIICNTDRPLYIPLLETARAPWLMEHEYHSLNLYPHLSGGLIYHGDPIAIHSWGSLHAIGVVRGNFLRVNFGVNIKWVKEFTSYVPVSLHYALGGYLKDLRNFDFSNVTDAEDMIKPNQYLCPIQTPDTFNLHITPEHSFKRMFDNTTLSGVTFKISKTDSDFANNPWGVGNLLEKCVIDFNNNHLRSHTIYAKCGNGVSKFNCEGFVILRNYFHSTEDVICLSNYKNVNAGGRDGLWEVFAPQMSEALAAPSERDAGYILPIGWGLYQYCKPINYDGLLRQQVEVPGFDWEEGLNRSVNSLADRTRYESRTLTFSQWQFDLLTEETIANAVAKNYTITIN